MRDPAKSYPPRHNPLSYQVAERYCLSARSSAWFGRHYEGNGQVRASIPGGKEIESLSDLFGLIGTQIFELGESVLKFGPGVDARETHGRNGMRVKLRGCFWSGSGLGHL
jgi:hypothetical protein